MERIESEIENVEEEYDELPLSDIERHSRQIILKKCNDTSQEYHISTCPSIYTNMESLHPVMEPSSSNTTNGIAKELSKPNNICRFCGTNVKKVIHELRNLYTREINRIRRHIREELEEDIKREEARKLYPNWTPNTDYESLIYHQKMLHVYETYLKMFSFKDYDL